jgi:hypothetical protein
MQASVDASLGKTLRIGEKFRVEARTEISDLLNRNNYITVNNIYGQGATPLATFLSPIAGINNVDPSREIQFVLRLLY